MIPQSPFSPFHQQRWIELYNDGSATIPARGIAEITDSYKPDTGSIETPSGGRTVLKVKQPTADNVANFVVNSMMSIAADKTGWGTMDYPAWVAYDTANTPAFGEEWGPQSGSCWAKKGKSGLSIYGDAGASGSTGYVRVGRRSKWAAEMVGVNDGSYLFDAAAGSTAHDFDIGSAGAPSGIATSSLFTKTALGSGAYEFTWNGADGTYFFVGVTAYMWPAGSAPSSDTTLAVGLRRNVGGGGYPTNMTFNTSPDAEIAWILHRFSTTNYSPNRQTTSCNRVMTLNSGDKFKVSGQKLAGGDNSFSVGFYRLSLTVQQVFL